MSVSIGASLAALPAAAINWDYITSTNIATHLYSKQLGWEGVVTPISTIKLRPGIVTPYVAEVHVA